MKKIKLFSRCLCFLLALNMLCQSAAATEITSAQDTQAQQSQSATADQLPYDNSSGDSSISNGSRSINAQVPLWGTGRLLETAGSAILYEINSDSMVYAWNPDLQVFPASLVKIMTCLLAVENCSLDETVTVTTTAIATLPKDTTLSFQVGETRTMEEMLYCMMTCGLNDAAVVVAEHVAGSQQAFVNMMNTRAREIGCTGTNFTNATGFHDDAQISTARDLVKMLREALKNENFFPFFSETSYTLKAKGENGGGTWNTSNYMMSTAVTAEYFDARVTGGRTGVTEARERCLIITAESKGLHYIAIVMCAKATMDEEGKIVRFGSYEEVKELINLGFSGYQVTQVLGEDQILTQFPVTNGENSVTIGPSETHYAVLPSELLTTDLSYRYQQSYTSLTAPVKAGETLTTVQVWYGNVCIAQAPIITKNSSDIAGNTDQSVGIEQSGEDLAIALRVIGILVGVVIIIVGVFYLVQISRRASRRAQHRRRRRNRRRNR